MPLTGSRSNDGSLIEPIGCNIKCCKKFGIPYETPITLDEMVKDQSKNWHQSQRMQVQVTRISCWGKDY